MDQQTITDILTATPSEDGAITKYDGSVQIGYRVRRLAPGELNELRVALNLYLAEQGISECNTATAEIFDQELELRVTAAAVMKPDSDEPLAPLDTWRRSSGPALRACLAHYTKLEAQDRAIDMATADKLGQLRKYVQQEQGPGRPAFWATIDYETLLACFIRLSLEHDQAERDMRELTVEKAKLRARLPKKKPRKKTR